MEFRDVILYQHARAHAAALGEIKGTVQDTVLNGVSPEQMRRRPAPGLDSLAWLFWHISRVEDFAINLFLAGRAQVLESGAWNEKLGVPLRFIGTRMTSADVDAFNAAIDLDAMLAYRLAVGRRTRQYLGVLRPEQLDELVDVPLLEKARLAGAFMPGDDLVPSRWAGKEKAYVLAHMVLGHTYQHLGEGYVLRGLLGLPNL